MTEKELQTYLRKQCHNFLVIMLLTAIVTLPSCSVKKKGAASRNYHAFVTRYNLLYNGMNSYREAVDDMIANFVDNDSVVLVPHPADMKAGADYQRFDYSIEKAQKAIVLYSKSNRDRVLADAWLLLCNCYFMKGRFDEAALLYAAAESRFPRDLQMVEICRIMQARCRVDMDRNVEASLLLGRVDESLLSSKNSKYMYYSTRSLIEANNGENYPAAESALKGVKFAPGQVLASRLKKRASMLSLLTPKPKVEDKTLDIQRTDYRPELAQNDEGNHFQSPEESMEVSIPFEIAQGGGYLVEFVFDSEEVNLNKMIYEIACFNFSTYGDADFDISRVGKKLLIGRFDNYDCAQSYIKRFVESNRELSNGVRLTPVSTDDLRPINGK